MGDGDDDDDDDDDGGCSDWRSNANDMHNNKEWKKQIIFFYNMKENFQSKDKTFLRKKAFKK